MVTADVMRDTWIASAEGPDCACSAADMTISNAAVAVAVMMDGRMIDIRRFARRRSFLTSHNFV